MHRREVLAGIGVGVATAIAGCSSSGGDNDGSGSSGGGTNWEHDETYTTTGDVEEALIGELEEGDQVELLVEVEQGRSVRVDLMNRDTGEDIFTRYVYRDERIESFNESNSSEVAAPLRTTVDISGFGEYYVSLAMLPDNLEVRLRFRTL